MHDDNLNCSKELERILKIDNDLKHPKQCMFKSCSSKDPKIRRHLTEQHRELNEDDLFFLVKTAKKIKANKSGMINVSESTDESEITTDSDQMTHDTERKKINHVNRKQNWSRCVRCNIIDHVNKTHDINSKNEEYYSIINNSKVIPSCYTEKVDKKTVV